MRRTLFILCVAIFTLSKTYANPPKKVGILVLAHGGNTEWNQTVIDATTPLSQKYPVEIAFGMALPRTMQEGIDKLEAKGVKQIVVVPLFVSSYSFIIRQTEYLLNKREELADPPLVMDHSMEARTDHSSNSSEHDMSEINNEHKEHDHQNSHGSGSDHSNMDMYPETLDRLQTNAEIILTKPLDNHHLVADILFEHITELSSDPSNETVIIVGHGPVKENDNLNWILTMEDLADQVRQKQNQTAENFKLILCTTVRDDADEEVYNQAKQNLRALVRQAGNEGDVIIVPQLLSKGGIEKGILERLEGLNYKWNGKMLAPHQNISLFLESSVGNSLNQH